MYKKAWWWLALIGVALFAAITVLFFRDDINDWYVLRSYDPPAEVAELANQSGMNDLGKKLFYVGKPTITSGEEFNSKCREHEETKVLGCIVTGQTVGLSVFGNSGYSIYILNVTEEDLAGIQEVTAAHEMLHAAYDRLSSSDKKFVDNEISKIYESLKNDKLKKTVEAYAEQDRTIVSNELHSLLATEVEKLSPALEKYYSRYFEDRSKVVAIYKAYEDVFDEARDAAQTLLGTINLMDSQINSLQKELQQESEELESERTLIESKQRIGDYDGLQVLVISFNKKVESFNNRLAYARNLIDERNELASQYEASIVKEQQLIDAIDSNVIPESKL